MVENETEAILSIINPKTSEIQGVVAQRLGSCSTRLEDVFSRMEPGQHVDILRIIAASHDLLLEEILEMRRIFDERLKLLTAESVAPVGMSMAQKILNNDARAEFTKSYGVATAAEVADIVDSKAKNKAAIASRWRRGGKIFAVDLQQKMHYPLFQFGDNGRPLEVIQKIISSLNPARTNWQIALWFTSRNGWLDGERPVDVLKDNPDAVVDAAVKEVSDLAT